MYWYMDVMTACSECSYIQVSLDHVDNIPAFCKSKIMSELHSSASTDGSLKRAEEQMKGETVM